MTQRARSSMAWLLLATLAVVAALTAMQVVRSVNAYVFWRIHADEPIEPWMTVGFVAHSYHVPPHILHIALGLPPMVRDRRPIERIARAKGITFEVARARLRYAIVHARPPYPPPAPPPEPSPPHRPGGAA